MIKQKINILIQPHHLRGLKYFDKLYYHLLLDNIRIIYLFRYNIEMVDYCLKNNRKYELLNFKWGMYNPLSRYIYKIQIKKLLKRNKIRVVIQYNDSSIYNNIIARIANKMNILTLVIQWAITINPDLYENRVQTTTNRLKRLLHLMYKPIYRLLGIHFINSDVFGHGESNIIGVINEYSKQLLMKHNIPEQKIDVLGSLNYDDILDYKYLIENDLDDIKKELLINDSEMVITYFSQPFSHESINFISKLEHMNFIDDLINNIYKKYSNCILFLKIHPLEGSKLYWDRFGSYNNVRIITQDWNNDLITISDIIIGHYSTVLQSAMVLSRHIICLNMLNLDYIKESIKVVGIKKFIDTWDEFKITLDNYKSLDNIDYSKVIRDGRCYERTINLITNLIRITELRQN